MRLDYAATRHIMKHFNTVFIQIVKRLAVLYCALVFQGHVMSLVT